MKTLKEMRAYYSAPERRAPKKKKSEAAQHSAAQLAKRRIQVVRKAHEMLRRVEQLTTAGLRDDQLRLMRDELVEGLWSLKNTKRDLKGLPTRVLQ